MTHHDVIDHTEDRQVATRDDTDVFVDFLAAEFPDWSFEVDATSTWGGGARQRWVATRDGHHPQSELTAGKLHRRLSDYEERIRARRPDRN